MCTYNINNITGQHNPSQCLLYPFLYLYELGYNFNHFFLFLNYLLLTDWHLLSTYLLLKVNVHGGMLGNCYGNTCLRARLATDIDCVPLSRQFLGDLLCEQPQKYQDLTLKSHITVHASPFLKVWNNKCNAYLHVLF